MNHPSIQGEFLRHEPCEKCGSSDAKAVYSSGTAYCFACEAYFKSTEEIEREDVGGERANKSLPSLFWFNQENRGIKPETFSKYGYGWLKIKGESFHAAPYRYKGKIVAYHLRSVNKDFPWMGTTKNLELFGQHLCKNSGEYRTRIVITEGELDCLSVSQAFGNKWQVVSIPSGAQSAEKYLLQNLEFLEGYSDIVLGFDNDDAGKEAVEKCVHLFTAGKVRVIDWSPYKDANEMLQAGLGAEICQKVYDAQQWRPDGIVTGESLFNTFMEGIPEGVSTPYQDLNRKFAGGFRKNEITLWTAGSGIGKSTVANEIFYDLGVNKGKRVGIIALEDTVKRTAERYVGMYLNKRIHLSREGISQQELQTAFNASIGNGNFVLYDHFGSIEVERLMAQINYMVVALKVEWILLDHVSIVISGNDSDNERKDLDVLMTALAQTAVRLPVGIHIISHLKRKQGKSYNDGGNVSLTDLRGSAGLEQLSWNVIALERDQQDEEKSNISQMRILKNRTVGITGLADTLEYNPETGRLLSVNGFNDELKGEF